MSTVPRISRVENIPSAHHKTIDCGPWNDNTDIVEKRVTIKGFAHKDLIVDDVLSVMGNDCDANDMVAELVYNTISDWEGTSSAEIDSTQSSSRTFATGSWTASGVVVGVSADNSGALGSTHRDVRSDGDSIVIPAGSWYGFHFYEAGDPTGSTATTGLSGLCISMRCREIS
jgi:hypothetical protein